jgi:hypothetical protein
MKFRFHLPFCFFFFAMASPSHAILISLDPLSSETDIYGNWYQRRLGSDSGTWFLPGGILLEIGLSREGSHPDPDVANIGDGRWAQVSCQFTATGDSGAGYPNGLFFNDADNLGDDVQFQIKQGLSGSSYTFMFEGNYLPATDEWIGSFRTTIGTGSPVPEGGGTLALFCGVLAGIHCLRGRLAWISA